MNKNLILLVILIAVLFFAWTDSSKSRAVADAVTVPGNQGQTLSVSPGDVPAANTLQPRQPYQANQGPASFQTAAVQQQAPQSMDSGMGQMGQMSGMGQSPGTAQAPAPGQASNTQPTYPGMNMGNMGNTGNMGGMGCMGMSGMGMGGMGNMGNMGAMGNMGGMGNPSMGHSMDQGLSMREIVYIVSMQDAIQLVNDLVGIQEKLLNDPSKKEEIRAELVKIKERTGKLASDYRAIMTSQSR